MNRPGSAYILLVGVLNILNILGLVDMAGSKQTRVFDYQQVFYVFFCRFLDYVRVFFDRRLKNACGSFGSNKDQNVVLNRKNFYAVEAILGKRPYCHQIDTISCDHACFMAILSHAISIRILLMRS